jgi:hypothetical protein
MGDLEAIARHDNGHDVEANPDAPRSVPGHPRAGEPPDARLLSTVDRFRRHTEMIGRPRLDLTKDKETAAPNDEIDLAAARSVVARKHSEASPSIEGRGKVLSRSPEDAS